MTRRIPVRGREGAPLSHLMAVALLALALLAVAVSSAQATATRRCPNVHFKQGYVLRATPSVTCATAKRVSLASAHKGGGTGRVLGYRCRYKGDPGYDAGETRCTRGARMIAWRWVNAFPGGRPPRADGS